MTMIPFLAIMLAASLTNNLAGFGMALVAMPLLIPLIGIKTATPFISLVGITLQLTMIWRYRRQLNLSAVRRLVVTSIVGIPLGVLAIDYLDETLLTTILGVVILLYVAYRWLRRDQFRPIPENWGYLLGFIGGLLGGALNTSGPPVVLYAESQNWPPASFKANLQTYFFCNGLIGVSTHWLAGNITAEVGRYYLLTLPVLAAGFFFRGISGPIDQTGSFSTGDPPPPRRFGAQNGHRLGLAGTAAGQPHKCVGLKGQAADFPRGQFVTRLTAISSGIHYNREHDQTVPPSPPGRFVNSGDLRLHLLDRRRRSDPGQWRAGACPRKPSLRS